jgi:hypothetical protein
LLTDQHGDPGVAPDGALTVDLPSARLLVRVEPDHEHAIIVLAVVVRDGVEPTSELLAFVATRDTPLGDVSVVTLPDDRATVRARHSLLGDTLDPDELRYAVETLASVAARTRADLESLLGPAPATETDSAASTTEWFTASLTVPLPLGWFGKESFTVLAPDGQANVIASSEPLDPSIDTERYAEVQRGLLEREFPEYHEIGSGELTLAGGITAHWREFGWKPPDGVRVRQVQLYAVPSPGRGYTATATSSDAGWDRYAAILRRTLFDVVVQPRRALS